MMRRQFWIIAIVIIVAAVVTLGQSIINNLSGCTDDLLSQFKRLSVAQTYERAYVRSLNAERREVWGFRWVINRQGDGCLVEAQAGGPDYSSGSSNYVTYHGDKFFINLKDRMVYPQSEGAHLIMNGKPVKLP